MDFEAIRRKRRLAFFLMGGRGGGSIAERVIVNRTTSFAGSPTEFSNLISGDANWWTSGDSTQINIPANFSYFRTTFWSDGSTGNIDSLRRSDNTSYRGIGLGLGTALNGYRGAVSAIIARSDVTALKHYDGASAVGAAGCWAMVEGITTLNPTALVYKSGNQALSTGAWDVLTWDSEVRDSDAFHDNVTNNSRLTIPASFDGRPARLVLGTRITDGTSASAQNAARMQRGGADFPGMGYITKVNAAGGNYYNAVSAIIPVSTGQYFEAGQFTSVASRNCLADDATFFEIEVLPSATKYVTLCQTTNFSITAATPTAVPFGTGSTVSDALNTHSESTDNTKVFVPSGVSFARVSFNLEGDGDRTTGAGIVYLNGAIIPDTYLDVSTGNTGNEAVNGSGAWFPVVQNDEIQLMAYSTSSYTFTAKNKNWLCVEFR